MLYALNNGVKVQATPGNTGVCPTCNTEMMAKCGDIKIWHWSHKNRLDCDDWHKSETDWHRGWKSLFPPRCVEVVVNNGISRHRADVMLPNGIVIEFQHSFISPEEIQQREIFYKNMIWVFDIQECVTEARFQPRRKNNYWTFRWKHPRKHIAYTISDCYLDIGYFDLFLLKKIYLSAPCGGWGYLTNRKDFLLRLGINQ